MTVLTPSRLSAFLVAAIMAAGTSMAADPMSLPVSVAVKTLRSAARVDQQMSDSTVMMRPEPPPATLPGERLPQYLLGYKRADILSQDEESKGEIRFILTAPAIIGEIGRPLLIRATVQIDGKPFSDKRKRKAQSIASLPTLSETSEETVDGAAAIQKAIGETDPGVEETPVDVTGYKITAEPNEVFRRYVTAVGEPPSEEDASWLLTHWIEGPPLLLLYPYFQSFRADERPAYDVLDRDHDGTVSPQELSSAVQSIQKSDANRDAIIDVLEISNSAKSIRETSAVRTLDTPLLLLLSELRQIAPNDPAILGELKPFDRDEDGEIGESEIDALRNRSPDVDMVVQFDTVAANKSKLTIVSVSPELQTAVETPSSIDGVNVKLSGLVFNFSAVQDATSDQISLGAVIDGYPLLPALDPNDDGRFTIRELRQFESRLRSFDFNGDGQLTTNEALPPIRVCIGLGATVHRELANVRSTKQTDQPQPIVGPEWFIRMDRNKDNDLTRGEFPGTDEQFAALDADSDDLVDATEAIEFDKRSAGTNSK